MIRDRTRPPQERSSSTRDQAGAGRNAGLADVSNINVETRPISPRRCRYGTTASAVLQAIHRGTTFAPGHDAAWTPRHSPFDSRGHDALGAVPRSAPNITAIPPRIACEKERRMVHRSGRAVSLRAVSLRAVRACLTVASIAVPVSAVLAVRGLCNVGYDRRGVAVSNLLRQSCSPHTPLRSHTR